MHFQEMSGELIIENVLVSDVFSNYIRREMRTWISERCPDSTNIQPFSVLLCRDSRSPFLVICEVTLDAEDGVWHSRVEDTDPWQSFDRAVAGLRYFSFERSNKVYKEAAA